MPGGLRGEPRFEKEYKKCLERHGDFKIFQATINKLIQEGELHSYFQDRCDALVDNTLHPKDQTRKLLELDADKRIERVLHMLGLSERFAERQSHLHIFRNLRSPQWEESLQLAAYLEASRGGFFGGEIWPWYQSKETPIVNNLHSSPSSEGFTYGRLPCADVAWTDGKEDEHSVGITHHSTPEYQILTLTSDSARPSTANSWHSFLAEHASRFKFPKHQLHISSIPFFSHGTETLEQFIHIRSASLPIPVLTRLFSTRTRLVTVGSSYISHDPIKDHKRIFQLLMEAISV